MRTELETVLPSRVPNLSLKPISNKAAAAAVQASDSIIPDTPIQNCSIKDCIQQKLDSLKEADLDQESPFFVGDLGSILRQHIRWKTLLPRVEPFFGKPSPRKH